MQLGPAGYTAKAFINSKLTPLIVFASILLGIGATLLLPREEEPQIKVPMIDIFVQMPGASAKEVEERIAGPMEKLIMGIPGDSPEQLLATLEHVKRLPCSYRVYHCLVLPDALLDRAPPSYELSFDPITLEMRSCLGWSADDLLRMADHLSDAAARDGGIHTRLWPDPISVQPGEPELGKPVGVSLWMFPNEAHEEHHRHRPR